MTDTLTATLRTNQGPIVIRLFPDHAPKTVRNFVELAEGGKEWTDPRTGRATTDKLYDGTVFHRVIPDFMIQGGDPLGSGRGGPGYFHSCWLASRAPSAIAASFAQVIFGSTGTRAAKVAKPQSLPAMTFSRPTTSA